MVSGRGLTGRRRGIQRPLLVPCGQSAGLLVVGALGRPPGGREGLHIRRRPSDRIVYSRRSFRRELLWGFSKESGLGVVVVVVPAMILLDVLSNVGRNFSRVLSCKKNKI